jgi:hypothetical protein
MQARRSGLTQCSNFSSAFVGTASAIRHIFLARGASGFLVLSRVWRVEMGDGVVRSSRLHLRATSHPTAQRLSQPASKPSKLVEQYIMLREDGMGVEQALIFVGHHWRKFHLRFQTVG